MAGLEQERGTSIVFLFDCLLFLLQEKFFCCFVGKLLYVELCVGLDIHCVLFFWGVTPHLCVQSIKIIF